MRAAELRHRVTLQNPGSNVSDGDGGFSQTFAPLYPSEMWASVQPATARDLERVVSNTVQSTASHLVTVRYLAGVTTKSRLILHDGAVDRTFSISGVHDPEERHVQLILACDEVVA